MGRKKVRQIDNIKPLLKRALDEYKPNLLEDDERIYQIKQVVVPPLKLVIKAFLAEGYSVTDFLPASVKQFPVHHFRDKHIYIRVDRE